MAAVNHLAVGEQRLDWTAIPSRRTDIARLLPLKVQACCNGRARSLFSRVDILCPCGQRKHRENDCKSVNASSPHDSRSSAFIIKRFSLFAGPHCMGAHSLWQLSTAGCGLVSWG